MKPQEGTLLSLIQYLSKVDREKVEHALKRANELHDGQKRDSGEPYITHPIAVAEFLARLEADCDTLVAALLHDVVEDEAIDLKGLREEFGPEIAKLVDSVTKLTKVRYEGKRAERQVASLRKMLLVGSDDLRVIVIKLADRWHNIETLDSLPPEKKQRIASETLDIYVPFARLTGLWSLKERFEEKCFPISFPAESKQWHYAVETERKQLHGERMKFVEHINAETAKHVNATLIPMTDYELFNKYQGDLQRLKETQNFDSVLIIINGGSSQPEDCYSVLGKIHMKYPVRLISFRDYISAPLPNGYRALHTTIFLSKNHEVRLRIQTEQMHEYVSKRKISAWINKKDNDIYAALSSLNKTAFDKERYLTDLKNTVLTERMNVFTTSGEIITLPRKGTGIDFAFNVNPDHLSYLAGMRVNGELHQATDTLQDGDTVELVLLNSKDKTARRLLWVEKAKSIEARESLKQSLSYLPKTKREEEGKSLLEFEFSKRNLPLKKLLQTETLQKQLADGMQTGSFQELLQQVGTGHIAVGNVAGAYQTLLLQTPSVGQRLLKFFNLLPRSRVLNADASIIELEIYAEDRQGLIYDITRCVAERKINIAKFEVFALPPKDALYTMRIEVSDFHEFSDLFDSLAQVPSVKRVLRKA